MVTRVATLLLSLLRSRVLRTSVLALAVAVGWGLSLQAQQAPLRKIGELELAIRGLGATVEPRLTVPKNVPSGVRVTVRAGAAELTAADAARMLGGPFTLRGELSGPGLASTIALPEGAADSDPFLLRLPAVTKAGRYTLNNLRFTRNNATILDVAPAAVDIEVIDEILITSVTTRPLTLDEIRARGIVLDSDDYLGFEFTLAMKLESTPVNFSFPVAFNRAGVAVPSYLKPPDVARAGVVVPTIVPVLLEATGDVEDAEGSGVPLKMPDGTDVRIPSVLVIPGNVGYLKQFFSAQLFVANGAPAGANLTVRDVTGTVVLPPGDDHVLGTTDDPLAIAETAAGGVQATLPVRGLGLDGLAATADDRADLAPGEQGQAEFLLRGEREGFHTVAFDITADLEGLAIGPVTVRGRASGGVLVRNPYYDITFTAPSVVREGEPFTLFATVTNIGQGLANDLRLAFDAGALSGVRMLGESVQQIDTLRAGDSVTFEFELESERTGQVVASYLKFDIPPGGGGHTGDLKFTVGVAERGVPLSPDTLVLPAVVDRVPRPLVKAAMRVLGQAWSAANAPAGTLRADVVRPDKRAITAKALALAEAGLRITLGQAEADALGDLAFDWYVGAPPTQPRAAVDAGLDQIHRETDAGHALARAFGDALRPGMLAANDPLDYVRARTAVAVSGADFGAVVVDGATGAITLEDAAGRRSVASRTATRGAMAVPGAAFLPLGSAADAPVLALIGRPLAGSYTLGVTSTTAVSIETTVPRGDGRFARGEATFAPEQGGVDASVLIDLGRPDRLTTAQTYGAEEVTDTQLTTPVASQGPQVVSATVVGPETLDAAGPFGQNAIVLFDRVVDAGRAAAPAAYRVTKDPDDGRTWNTVAAAQTVLSGRFVALSLAQPEGPYVPMRLRIDGMPDARGAVGLAANVPLASRLAAPGAVVTGRVQQADGTAVAGSIVYANSSSPVDCRPANGRAGLAATPLDVNGQFELRYVWQGVCGFEVITTDPQTGGRLSQRRHVRIPGERIQVDFTLFARGSVTGIVRSSGVPVGGARVVAVSTTDPQVGATAPTDGEGRYVIPGLLVGGITVRAVYGTGAGYAAGHIDRGGSTAVVDVALDGDSVRVSGIVETQTGQPVRGAIVTYFLTEGTTQLVGALLSDAEGRFVFERMPKGAFQIRARYDRFSGQASDVAAPGDDKTVRIVVNVPEMGSVSGVVELSTRVPVPNAVVFVGGRGQLTDAEGRFSIADVPVGAQNVSATSPDGLRQGQTQVTVYNGQTSPATITLGGLGTAAFRLIGPDGVEIRNGRVTLSGNCSDPCGCTSATAGPDGRYVFPNLRLGRVEAKGFRQVNGVYDSATASISLTRDGETVEGVIRLRGYGSVTGLVWGVDGRAAHGADVLVTARRFVNDGGLQCGMVDGPAHRVRTGTDGRFTVPNVAVGGFIVTATHAFAPTPASARGAIVNAGQNIDVVLQLTDTTSGVLSGTVFRPDGVTPIGAGAEVTATGVLPDVTVRTDDAGAFHFARIFPQGHYVLTARDPQTGGQFRQAIYLSAGEDFRQDLTLKGRGRLIVNVEDAAGESVGAAFVRVTEEEYPAQRYERAIESGGQAIFERVFEGPVMVEASDVNGRGGRVQTEIVDDGDEVVVTVRLGAVGVVSGRLLLPLAGGGDALTPSADVKLLVGNRVVGQTTTGASGEQLGTFRFDYVPAGTFKLEATDPATARRAVGAGTLSGQGQEIAVDLRLEALGTVEGTATSNGAPQPAANIQVRSGVLPPIATLADSSGRYRVEGVPAGPISVTGSLSLGGFLTGTSSGILAGEGTTLTLDVALRGSGVLDGQVTTAHGTAAAFATVRVSVGGVGGGTQTTTTDSQGFYHFDRVPSGEATVVAEARNSIDTGKATVTVPAGGAAVAPIALNGVGPLTVLARDSSGNPVSGSVRVTGTGTFPFSTLANVGPSGTFTWAEVLAGPVTVSLESTQGGFRRFGSQGGIVAASNPAAPTASSIEVRLQASGTVTLRVVRADGVTPAPAADVRLQFSSGGSGAITPVTGADGRVTAEGVPLGTFFVRVSDPISGGVAYLPSATLATDNQTLDLGDLRLDDTLVAIESTTPADGATDVSPFTNVQVVFTDPLEDADGIDLLNGSTVITGLNKTLSADRRTVTFSRPNASAALPPTAQVTIRITNQVTDIYGRVGSSRVDLQACKLEYSIVSPK